MVPDLTDRQFIWLYGILGVIIGAIWVLAGIIISGIILIILSILLTFGLLRREAEVRRARAEADAGTVWQRRKDFDWKDFGPDS